MKALGFPRAARDLEKYWEDQPRVPAGSGRESGEWTSSGGGGANFPAEALWSHGQTLSDISIDSAGPTQQYAQSNRVSDLPDGTLIEPFGEPVVSYKNLPDNARDILKYRFFIQKDDDLTWGIGMEIPDKDVGETRRALQVRGQGAGIEESGVIVAPREAPPLPPEGSGRNPASAIRLGGINWATGEGYFRTYNRDGQAISPVTGRTVNDRSEKAPYPIDVFRSRMGE